MARLASVATALPPHRVPLAETLHRAAQVFGRAAHPVEHLLALIERCGIEQRFLVVPVDEVIQARPLEETSRRYREHALRLSLEVAPTALARAGLTARHVDHLVTVSCTGVMIPSLDAELMNLLPFRSDCRRTPITELGCAGGAVGLSRARDHVIAHPGETVLLVAVEIPSLTFQPRDLSVTNMVASAIFADGAAAAVVTSTPGDGITIVDSHSELFPGTQHIMGFELRDGGFHIKLDRELVSLLDREIASLVTRFLAPHRMTVRDLRFFALHPGGRRLLEVIESRLGLPREALHASWEVLREYGNMSSATVLFVLERLLRHRSFAPGDRGLLAAFGPGFSAEMLLLQWQ